MFAAELSFKYHENWLDGVLFFQALDLLHSFWESAPFKHSNNWNNTGIESPFGQQALGGPQDKALSRLELLFFFFASYIKKIIIN